jgi:hypothetical protein
MSPAQLFGPFPATLADCESTATCHHSAFSAAQLPLYRGLWGNCKDEEMVEFHVEITKMLVLESRREGMWRIAVVREGSGEGEVVQVAGYVAWSSPMASEAGNEGGKEGKEGSNEGSNEGSQQSWEGGKYVKKAGEPWIMPQGHNAALMKRSAEDGDVRRGAISLPG